MQFDEAFVSEIRANPHDDVPRLILADYLEDSGHPMGKFIRVQVELGKFEGTVEKRMELKKAETQLREEHGESWLQPLRDQGVQGVSTRCFNRGMVERIRITATDFIANGAEIFRLAPALHVLELRELWECQNHSELAIPDQIHTLDLSSCRLGENDAFGGIDSLSAPWLGDAKELILSFNRLVDNDIWSLAAMLKQNLEGLQLDSNLISTGGLEAITNSASFSTLKRLSLNLNQIDQGSCRLLAAAPNLFDLQSLSLASNPFSDSGTQRLLKSGAFTSLKHLNLRSCQITSAMARKFDHSPLVAKLESLDLRNNVGTLINDLSWDVKRKLVE